VQAIGDLTTRTLQAALQGLAAQRTAAQRNVANVETPGYLADRVDFESALAAAVESGDPFQASVSTTKSLAATNVNGNNVSLDTELTELSENGVANQVMVQALSAKYQLLRTAISGS
jgi:flagellar basal-body rod protein FlgB